MKEELLRINPDLVQLNTLDRPGSLAGIEAVPFEELRAIKRKWQLENVEIIAPPVRRRYIHSYSESIEEQILATISRRPCTLDDLYQLLGIHINEINKYLSVLEQSGALKKQRKKRGVFYMVNS